MEEKFDNAKFQVGDFVTITDPRFSINTIAIQEISVELLKPFLSCHNSSIGQDNNGVYALLVPKPIRGQVGYIKAIDHRIYDEDDEHGIVDVYTYALTCGNASYFILEFGLEIVDSLIFKN